VWACFVGFLGGYTFNVYMQHGTPGSFLDTYSAFVIPGDFVLAFVKSVILEPSSPWWPHTKDSTRAVHPREWRIR
jgi:hypothetical protein